MKINDLPRLAKGFGIPNYDKLSRAELEEKVLEAAHKRWEKDQKTLSKAEREALTQFREGRKQAAAAPTEPAQIVTKEERQMATAAVQQQQEGKVSKSDLMRQLYDEGLTVAQIAKRLKSNYSFVYSVIKRYKEEGAPERKKETKSEIMRRMYDEGKTVAQIAKELNANYSFVYGVIKRYKEELELQSRK